MPRYGEPPETMTPFAQLLVNYMWNRRPWNRPPLTGPQLAAKIGVPKQSITNWIIKGSVPPFETMLVVLAKLGISMRELYDAYQKAGLTVPAWDNSELAEQPEGAAAAEELPETPRHRKASMVPHITTPPNALAPRPYIPPKPLDPAAEQQRLLRQTARAFKEAGASDELIEQALAHIQAQEQAVTPMEQHIIAEHSEDQRHHNQQPDQPSDQQPDQQPRSARRDTDHSNYTNHPDDTNDTDEDRTADDPTHRTLR